MALGFFLFFLFLMFDCCFFRGGALCVGCLGGGARWVGVRLGVVGAG